MFSHEDFPYLRTYGFPLNSIFLLKSKDPEQYWSEGASLFDASPVREGSQNIFCCAAHAFMEFSSSAHFRSGESNLGLQEQD